MGRYTSSSKVLLPVRYLDPHLICDSFDPLESAPKRHLDRFSCFCTTHPYAQHTETDRQTEHATCDICSSRPDPMHYVQTLRLNDNKIFL